MRLIAAVVAAGILSSTAVAPRAASAQAGSSEFGSLRKELPLIELPGSESSPTLVVFVSGDGGWAAIEKDMSAEFNNRGAAVIGFDLREYLRRKRRTPEDVARDVARVYRAYSDAWGKPSVVLLGFSRGAGMLPFILNRLPADIDSRLKLTAFVGLPRTVNMTFHWIDIIRDVSRSDDIPVIPELQRASPGRMVCIYGGEELLSGCRTAPVWVKRVQLPGGHHLERAYRSISDSVFKYLPM
ncbi:MAG: virulence factor [Gemmatimonadota bacterium]|nr:virulence factor [Gemmatimonadota bacterium]